MVSCKKTLHIITGLSIGGSEMMLYKILSGAESYAMQCKVVALTPSGYVGEMIEDLGIEVVYLNFKNKILIIQNFFKLISVIRKFKPDIIQTWLYHSDLIGFLAYKASMWKCQFFWNIRCSKMRLDEYAKTTLYTIKLCSKLSKYVDGILTNSFAAKEHHIDNFKYWNEKFHVIPNGFDSTAFFPDIKLKNLFRKENRISKHSICVGLIARFDFMKGHSVFLKAVNQINCFLEKDKHPIDIKYIMAGRSIDPDNKNLMTLIEKYGLEDQVVMLGERRDIPVVLNGCDIVVSSSHGEGFPNIIGEAMLCGVPCVVTDVGDSALIVGDTGIIVPSNDSSKLAQGVIDMIKMGHEDREHIGLMARKRIIDHYSLDQIIKEYARLYCQQGKD